MTTERSGPATVSILGRLLGTRAIALAAAVMLAGLALCADTIRVATRMRAVDLAGIDLAHDEVVAVAGVRGLRLESVLTEVPVGATTTVTLARGGAVRTLTVPTRPLPEVHAVALWIRVVCGVACFLLGVVSFVLAPGSRAAWLFLLFCANLALTLLFNVAFEADDELFLRIQSGTFALGGSLGLHLMTEIPERLDALARRPWLAALIYAPAAPLVVWALLGATFSPTRALLAVSWSLLSGVFSLTILVNGVRRAPNEALRSRYQTLLIGIVVGLFLPTVIHMVREVFEIGGAKWITHMNAAPVVAYAGFGAYALLRQNVLGADRVTTLVVSYAATIIGLAVGCGVLLVTLALLLPPTLTSTPLELVVTTALASLSVVPVYRRVKAAIDRRFQRDHAGAERLATAMHELMQVTVSGDMGRTMAAAREALLVLQPERAELWHKEGDSLRCDDSTAPVPLSGPLASALAAGSSGGVDGLTARLLPAEAQTELWERGLALAAPIVAGRELRGFAAVGRRASGGRYRGGDEAFVALVASQVGLALERVRGTPTIGRYRLERRLGVGGMAEVFLARKQGLGGFERRVAIKRPLPYAADDPGFVAMFIEEAKLAAQLHHPNIVGTFEVDRVDGTTYIAMEYVEGATLRVLLRAARARAEAVPRPIVHALIDALLAALAHAHAAVDAQGRQLNIVHRDVTPGNLLVSLSGEVKLADFGVARSASRLSVTQTGVIKGTIAYMAPEQAMGAPVDARTDLFGAGAVLFDCLVGQPPYPDGPPEEPPATPRPLPIEPPALAQALARALAFDPADRWASADEMRAAIAAAVAPLAPARAEEVATWARALLTERPEEPVVPDGQTALDRR
jgi:hypothetical protein